MLRIHIVVWFIGGHSQVFDVFEDGNWWRSPGGMEDVPQLVIRPHGRDGNRYHVPLHNVLYFQVVFP